jgi:hypothetical protein
VTVTHQPLAIPDLLAVDIVPQVSCFANGDTVDFEYQYRNIGDPTSTPFKIEIKVDGTLIKTDDWTGAANSVDLGRIFSYTFSSSLSKTITFSLDTGNAINEYSEANNSVSKSFTPQASCGPTPTPARPETITGDFHFDKSSINFGQSNGVYPDNVSVSGGTGCTMTQFGYTFTQGSLKYDTVSPTSSPVTQNFAGPPYPGGMGGGTVSVTMTIKTSCGTTKVVGPKTFDIIVPAGNNPPVFNASWFAGGNSFGYPKVYEVVVGNYVDLGVVHDPTESAPKTPYDPDGDGIVYTWDFKNSTDPWIKALYDKFGNWEHDEHYGMIKADVLGTHTVYVSAVDTRGATVSPRAVTINVVPPNPVPIITVPPKIVERRPFTPDFSGTGSYSPGGYTITQYIWGNKKSVYPTAGPQTITLDVVDSNGLHALSPASQNFTVLPDLPPVVDATLASKGLRGVGMTMHDGSYSPDGDVLVQHTDKIICDTNLNGSFADDPQISMTLNGSGDFTYTPTVLAACVLRVYVKEDWGNTATKDYPFTIVNQTPTVQISVKGDMPSPPVVDGVNFNMQDLVNDKARFNSEDHYATSRPSDMYYDPT